jgi:hypothetical protein
MEERFRSVWPSLSEKERRLFAAAEARKWGYGGISLVSDICGLSRSTISKGLKELEEPQTGDGRIRRPGAGRPNLTKSDPDLPDYLDSILEMGPDSSEGGRAPLSWTLKSTRNLARELSEAKHPISYVKVGQVLKELGFQLKSNKKLGRGKTFPDSGAQYELINSEVSKALKENRPVLYLSALKADAQKSQKFLKTALSHTEFLSEQIIGWFKEEGGEAFPELESLLVIVNENTGSPAFLEEFTESLEKGLKDSSVSLSILSFPPGTHRWNLNRLPLFKVTAKVSDTIAGSIMETRAFLIAWELPSLKEESSQEHFVEFVSDEV